LRAIIMAGGKGTRLRPYTTLIPKPLVPIGGNEAVIEIIIRQLVRDGFNEVTICLNHQANLIQSYLGNGERWNIRVNYSLETMPLGTIGPLALLSGLPDDFLVMNGDVLCDIDYGEFLRAHKGTKRKVSVATHSRDFRIDFGVVDTDEAGLIIGFREKPAYFYQVSMGIYCVNRTVVEGLPRNTPYGFDNLMLDGIRLGKDMAVMKHSGFWVDIGRPDEYDYCNENYQELKQKLRI